MSTAAILELVLAVALLVGGAWLYRRRDRGDGGQDSQGAVILMIIGAILAIHGSGLLEYRPVPQ